MSFSEAPPAAAIRVEGLSKRYRLGASQPYRRLGESIVRAVTRPFRGKSARRERGILWALKDVSLTVDEGEILGVIGPNGAGKTTLLRILAKITLPTDGRAEIHGRVGSLLEVGTGFHPELTGRENVYLNGAILGMTRKEITRKYEEIVEFAQIEEFMETPVKHYSSGMRVRLAFSVAAHLEPEILFIDEVLSVGDAAFQAKCLKKMEEVAGGGRTVLFVSHAMGSVTSLCTRCIWIDHGRIQMDGDPQTVVESYLTQGYTSDARWEHPKEMECGQDVRMKSIEILGPDGRPDAHVPFEEPVRILVEHEVRKPVQGLALNLRILDTTGTVILTTGNLDAAPEENSDWEIGTYRHTVDIPGSLLRPGRYVITAIAKVRHMKLDEHEHCLGFEVMPIRFTKKRIGVIMPMLPWVPQDEGGELCATP
jgi:lipopolysaccharide transport system ATP-binding protein